MRASLFYPNLPRILLSGIVFLIVGCFPGGSIPLPGLLLDSYLKSSFPSKRYEPYRSKHSTYTEDLRSRLGLVGVRVVRAHVSVMEEITNNLLEQIIHQAQVQADRHLIVLGDAHATSSILEVIVNRAELQDNRSIFSRLWKREKFSARMSVHVKLLYAGGQKEIFSFPNFTCRKGNDALTTWTKNQSQNYLAALRACETMLAEKIVQEVFLVDTEISSVSYRTLLMISSYDKASLVPKVPLNDSLVPSLNPALQWEPFRQADNVTYDLRIWNAKNEVPDSLVYAKEGLPVPSHHLSQLLLPDTTYFWAVRGQYWKNGQRRVTPWSHPSGIGMRKTPEETVPHRHMYRFRTP